MLSQCTFPQFDAIPYFKKPSKDADNELERYLSAPVEFGVTNPLEWWWARRREYPRLSKMALGHLSIPGELNTSYLCLYAHEIGRRTPHG